MADTLQLRGGTTSQNSSFTGSDREVTVDTTKKTLIVHDGSVAGGFPLMKETGNSSNIEAVIGGAVTLKHNTSTKLATESNGIRVTGNIFANDNQGLLLGTNGTFRINYNGSNCQVTDEGTGDLLLGASKIKLMTANLSTATGIDCNPAGTTSINHAGSLVFKTLSSGVHVNGNLGVGVTTVPQKLTVGGNAAVVNSNGIQIIQLNRESDKGKVQINDDQGNTKVQFVTDDVSYFNGGNLAIGKTTAARPLDIDGGMRLSNDSVVEWGGTTAAVYGSSSSNVLFFKTGSNESMRLDSNGQLGVGSSAPTSNEDGAGLKVDVYQTRAKYHTPEGKYGASLGKVTNSNTKVWAAIDSGYNQTSAESAGLFLKAYHLNTGGSGCGFTIKNVKTNNDLVFSEATTGTGTEDPANENEKMRVGTDGVSVTGNLSATGSQIDFTALPTSDPNVAGRLWRSGTDLKVSVG